VKKYIKNELLKTVCKTLRKAQNREITTSYENHHVFPKSIYGKNKYIVKLSPREPYIAHALLYKGFKKRYGKDNIKSIKMAYAFRCMHIKNSSQDKRHFNSKLYEKLRAEFILLSKGKNAPFFGRKHSLETRKKQSEIRLGRKHPLFEVFGENHPSFGRIHSDESKSKMREIKLGENNPMYGKKHTEFVLKRLREANIGRNNPNYGKKWFNDGERSILTYECPSGFKPGRLMNHLTKSTKNA
jgi:hypothetical protein